MNELTFEDQRLLTEFLGECWHEAYNGFAPGLCSKCEASKFDSGSGNFLPVGELHLDFSDWRVVGRLLDKIENIEVWKSKDYRGSWGAFTEGIGENVYASTPQLAICKAVLAYLKEKEQ